MSTSLPIRVVRDCRVVGHPVLLSRDRIYVDYLMVEEGEPTCSHIHPCLQKHVHLKNIPECLLHDPSHIPSHWA